ncbi:S8 family serine peptidase [Streptomyces sp. NPDC046862]|uniref:S8 family serine peptidase n=1 Tax=Streptomyces sp. NPDC046862 TaxID=3154603 RepID=UPI0034539D93
MHIVCRMRCCRCRRAAKLAAVAALPALLLSTLTAPAAHAAEGDPVSLPVLRLRVGDDGCTGASATSAETRPWTWQALQLSRSWQLSRGAGVTVGVVDTGVGGSAPALRGRVTAVGGAGEDCVGHGSFVAGLIAGAPTGEYGVVAGVAPSARVLAVRGTDQQGSPSAELIAQGIEAVVGGGADVVYVGQVVAGDSGGRIAGAVAHASAKDVLVVAPAAPDTAPEGADGTSDTRARAYFPARVPEVLSVVDYGPDGGRPEGAPSALDPDLAAPGDAVVGIGPRGTGHFLGSGSSLAAAHVAGAAALIRSYQPDLSAVEVSRRLVEAGYPDAVARLDTYAGLTAVLATAGAAEPGAAAVHVAPSASSRIRFRTLLIAGGGLAVVLLVAAAMAVVPRGNARKWRAAG